MTDILADAAVFWIVVFLPSIVGFMFDRRLRWWIFWIQIGSFVSVGLIWLMLSMTPSPVDSNDVMGAVILTFLIPGVISFVLFPISLIPWKKEE